MFLKWGQSRGFDSKWGKGIKDMIKESGRELA